MSYKQVTIVHYLLLMTAISILQIYNAKTNSVGMTNILSMHTNYHAINVIKKILNIQM
jgi:hypothetical protein